MNDDYPEPPPRGVARLAPNLVADLAMGLRLYSRLPLGDRLPHQPPELDRIALALPFVSLAIGLLPALIVIVLTLLDFPGIFAAAIAVVVLLVLTGAMAEDGLADAADGLFGGATATRRLEIMRDSRHGTYGVLALVLFVLLRVVAIGAIAQLHRVGAGGTWLAAMVLSRSGSLWLAVVLPPARVDGLSAAVGGVTRLSFAVGMALAVIIAAVLAIPAIGLAGTILALLLCAGVVAGWTMGCQRLVGGQTGDLIGALQALIELTALTVFLAFA